MVEQNQTNFLSKSKYLMMEIVSFAYTRTDAQFKLRHLSKRGLQISKDPYLNNIMEPPNDLCMELRKVSELDILYKALKYTKCVNMPMCLCVEIYPEDLQKIKNKDQLRQSEYISSLSSIRLYKKLQIKFNGIYTGYNKERLTSDFYTLLFQEFLKQDQPTIIGKMILFELSIKHEFYPVFFQAIASGKVQIGHIQFYECEHLSFCNLFECIIDGTKLIKSEQTKRDQYDFESDFDQAEGFMDYQVCHSLSFNEITVDGPTLVEQFQTYFSQPSAELNIPQLKTALPELKEINFYATSVLNYAYKGLGTKIQEINTTKTKINFDHC